MKSEDKLNNLLESIKDRADSDFASMHEMSKDEFISEYGSRVMDVAFTYYKEQCEEARIIIDVANNLFSYNPV